MLCKKCCNIHFQRIEDCELIKQDPKRLRRADLSSHDSGSVFYFHHRNKQALERSADLGCHFCAMLWKNLVEDVYLQSSHHFARGEVILRRSIRDSWIKKTDSGLEEWNKQDWIFATCGTSSAKINTVPVSEYSGPIVEMLKALTTSTNVQRGELRTETDTVVEMLEAWKLDTQNLPNSLVKKFSSVAEKLEALETRTDVDSVAISRTIFQLKALLGGREKVRKIPPDLQTRHYSPWLDTSTASPASLALASIWLKNCLENHQPCREARRKCTFPSLIINISRPQRPFLDDGKGRGGRYVTLSYKWGENRIYVTTTKNVTKHRNKISLRRLPRTFTDAIHVARSLGFRWLWIDALCILQDCKEDIKRHISKMDKIFQFSTLTLYAAAGDNADAGISVLRDPRWIKPCLLNLKNTLGETVERSMYIKFDLDYIDYSGRTSAPLFERGWVLQEQVLAPRGLVFGSRELAWRCLCGYSTETSPKFRSQVNTLHELGEPFYSKWRLYSPGWDGFDLLRMWIQKRNPLPDRAPGQRDNQFDHWYAMVNRYSRRSLTHSSDVLPALEGLAAAIAKTHQCTYFAGLWKDDLQIGLIWFIYWDTKVSGENVNENEFGLPSWSWASHWGKVIRFCTWEINNSHIEHEGVSLIAGPEESGNSDPNSPGMAMNKSLVLTGRLRTAKIMLKKSGRQKTGHSGNNDWENGRWMSKIKDSVSGKVVGQIALDSDPRHARVRRIHCLLCTVREKYGKWQLTCLGLVPTNNSEEEFSRIGLVFIRQPDWFGKLDQASLGRKDTQFLRTIRIV